MNGTNYRYVVEQSRYFRCLESCTNSCYVVEKSGHSCCLESIANSRYVVEKRWHSRMGIILFVCAQVVPMQRNCVERICFDSSLLALKLRSEWVVLTHLVWQA